jgi:hypothetical protein
MLKLLVIILFILNNSYAMNNDTSASLIDADLIIDLKSAKDLFDDLRETSKQLNNVNTLPDLKFEKRDTMASVSTTNANLLSSMNNNNNTNINNKTKDLSKLLDSLKSASFLLNNLKYAADGVALAAENIMRNNSKSNEPFLLNSSFGNNHHHKLSKKKRNRVIIINKFFISKKNH